MFRIASGDPWPESLPVLDENGSIDYTTCLYFCSFVIIVAWVYLTIPAESGSIEQIKWSKITVRFRYK